MTETYEMVSANTLQMWERIYLTKIPSLKNYQDHLSDKPKESIFLTATTPKEILGIIARFKNKNVMVLMTFHLLC